MRTSIKLGLGLVAAGSVAGHVICGVVIHGSHQTIAEQSGTIDWYKKENGRRDASINNLQGQLRIQLADNGRLQNKLRVAKDTIDGIDGLLKIQRDQLAARDATNTENEELIGNLRGLAQDYKTMGEKARADSVKIAEALWPAFNMTWKAYQAERAMSSACLDQISLLTEDKLSIAEAAVFVQNARTAMDKQYSAVREYLDGQLPRGPGKFTLR